MIQHSELFYCPFLPITPFPYLPISQSPRLPVSPHPPIFPSHLHFFIQGIIERFFFDGGVIPLGGHFDLKPGPGF